MKTLAPLLLAGLLLPATLAAEGSACDPPVRIVTEAAVDAETRAYVVQYHFEDSDYLFVYEESNGVPGVQTHFDLQAGCSDAAEADTVLSGGGGNVVRYPPL